ncbi:MAG: class I SAM-dependent methyltransferase [Oscillospiraceae bacterium]|jgi:SAM-dependent methyltransferase|nr:class I SAM-dependent methyltransferase [Oscillospiraceae bacterium]
MNPITEYYNSYDEDGRLMSRHGQVEYLTTMWYIEKYLFPGARILDIGAGTGRYSLALAKLGYVVDAVELVEHNIDIFKQNTPPGASVTVRRGDALELSGFSDETYDLTLILGPLYHMYTQTDKLRVIREALRVTKPGGVLFAAYCVSDASILQYGFIGGRIKELMRPNDFCGLAMPGFKAYSTPKSLFEIIRREDIDELMRGFDVERLHYVATDLYTNHMREMVDAMDDETFALYLDYHFFLCERPDMAGLTHHSLDIFRKPKQVL